MGKKITVYVSETGIEDLRKGAFDTVVALVETKLRSNKILIDEDRISNRTKITNNKHVSIDSAYMKRLTKKYFNDCYGDIGKLN